MVDWEPYILGLYGNYGYSQNGKTLTISNGDAYFPMKLILKKQDGFGKEIK
jgi:hypothetical protein